MVQVLNQKEAKRRRANLSICYLCGGELSGRQTASREHIVPRSVLGVSTSSSAWPLILCVHAHCEENKKRESDAMFVLWQRFMMTPEDQADEASKAWDRMNDMISPPNSVARLECAAAVAGLAAETTGTTNEKAAYEALATFVNVIERTGSISGREKARVMQHLAAFLQPKICLDLGHYRNTPLKVVDATGVEDNTVPLGGVPEIQKAVWTWIRGFHAVLYGTFLDDKTSNLVLSAIPMFRRTDKTRILADDSCHCLISAVIGTAGRSSKLDRVLWWDGQCDFKCVWVHSPEIPELARCTWSLNIPGPSDSGTWRGWYDMKAPPTDASLLDQSDLDAWYEVT